MKFKGWNRNDVGALVLPDDTDVAALLWSERDENDMNCKLIYELVDTYTKLGDTILDPMSSRGTIQLAALAGRHVISIAQTEELLEIQIGVSGTISTIAPEAAANIIVVGGDCRLFMPLINDCIICQPPYHATQATRGHLSYIMYTAQMKNIYSELANTARLGVFVVRNVIDSGKIQPLIHDTEIMLQQVGWKLKERLNVANAEMMAILVVESKKSDWLLRK